MKPLLTLTLALVLPTTTVISATYIEPKNHHLLFQPDRLPIDVDTMSWLSEQLVIVAAAVPPERPDHLRAKAQLIAIATQLDSANDRAEELNRTLKNQLGKKSIPRDELAKATARVWSITRYLSSETAGKEANLLAQRLKDPMVLIDPKHPATRGHKEDSNRWASVVPRLEKYATAAKPSVAPTVSPPNRPRVADVPFDEPDAEGSGEENPINRTQWHVTKQAIMVMAGDVEVNDHHRTYKVARKVMTLDISPQDVPNGLEIRIKPSFERDHFLKGQVDRLKTLLGSTHKNIPDAKVDVLLAGVKGKLLPTGSQQAGLAIALNASLANQKLRDNLMVLGSMDRAGKLHRGSKFWRAMKVCAQDTTSRKRILVPAEAEEDFIQLIALEQPGFFVRNEVIAIADLEDSLNYSGIEGEGDVLQATLAFREFQKVAGTRAVGPLVANRHVRAKLEEVVKLMPNHVSAKALLLQGGGSRPLKLDSRFLAYELEDILGDLDWLVKRPSPLGLERNWVERQAESIDEKLEALAPYVDSADKKLLEDSQAIVSELKILGRAIEKDRDSDYHERLAKKSFNDARYLWSSLRVRLSRLTGEGPRKDS